MNKNIWEILRCYKASLQLKYVIEKNIAGQHYRTIETYFNLTQP